MALRLNSNILAGVASTRLQQNSSRLSISLERLSSGLRINRAADDAAGLAISEALRADIRSMGQAVRNTNDAISLMNVAEGGLAEQSSILVRMRELASQSATGTVNSAQRAVANGEFSQLSAEIDRIANTSEFNGIGLLAGGLASGATSSIIIQVGIQGTSNDQISINTEANITASTASTLGISTLSLATSTGAQAALTSIDSAISTVTSSRGRIGAVQNRLVHSASNLQISQENLRAAESQIRDADYAKEVTEFTKNQIMTQATTAVLAQANLIPQNVLQLLA